MMPDLKLGWKAEQLRVELLKWIGTYKDATDTNANIMKQTLHEKIIVLVQENPQDFVTLINIPKISQYFFVSTMLATPKATEVFLNEASRLKTYTDKMMADFSQQFQYSLDIEKYRTTITALKSTLKTIIDYIVKKQLSPIEEDAIYVMILESAFSILGRKCLAGDDRTYLKAEIIKILDIYSKEDRSATARYPFLKEACAANELDLVTKILEQNADIPPDNPRHKSASSDLEYLATRLRDFNNSDCSKVLQTFLDQSLKLNTQILDDCLRKAVLARATYAFQPLVGLLIKDEKWDKLSHLRLIYDENLVVGSGSMNDRIRTIMVYLDVIEVSVYEMLKYFEQLKIPVESSRQRVADAAPKPTKKEHLIAIINLLLSDYGKGSFFTRNFYHYEAREAKGLFYFLAESPEVCKQLRFDAVEERFATAYTHSTSYCGLWVQPIPGAPLLANMFVKNDPELCPLLVSAKQNKFHIIQLVLDCISKFNVYISQDLKDRTKTAIAEFTASKATSVESIKIIEDYLSGLLKSQYTKNKAYIGSLIKAVGAAKFNKAKDTDASNDNVASRQLLKV